MKSESIIRDFFYTIFTLGFYNLWVQFRQMEDVNEAYSKNLHSFTKTMILSALTFGTYFLYHEYRLTTQINKKLIDKPRKMFSLWVIPATFLGLWPLVDSYQQALLNALNENRQYISAENKIELFLIVPPYIFLLLVALNSMISSGEVNDLLDLFF